MARRLLRPRCGQPSAVAALAAAGGAGGEFHASAGRPAGVPLPWEGATLVGTTDLDHGDVNQEAAITAAEVAYLLQALDFQFPDLKTWCADVLSTYAGVRPVVNTGKADPSAEGRDHVVLLEHGLLTVTGGKLTTFRVIALDALAKVRTLLPDWDADLTPEPIFTGAGTGSTGSLAPRLAARLSGRYGAQAKALLAWRNRANCKPSPPPTSAGPSCAGRRAMSRWCICGICCCAAPGWACWCRAAAPMLLPRIKCWPAPSWAGTTSAGKTNANNTWR